MSFLTRATKASPSLIFRAQRATFSSQNSAAESGDPRFYPVYVHHLSKVCLEHLQDTQSEWLEKEGLANGLDLNRDGTFTLHFPRGDGRIW